jgi:predicted outer membrane repeat protein
VAVRYVSRGTQLGDDGWTGEHPTDNPPGTGPYRTIQHGVDELAKLNDPVKVLNLWTYRYPENVKMHGPQYSGITIIGFNLGSYDPAVLVQFCEARPVVDGQGRDRVFDIADVVDVRLVNLGVANGKTAEGGAGISIERSHVDIKGCCIHDNAADKNGGGFWYHECKVSGKVCHVEDSYVWSNTAGRNGGGGDVADTRWLFVSRTLFRENSALHQGGGGLCVYDSSHVTVQDNCLFDHNHAPAATGTYYGGGADGLGGGLLIDRCDKAPTTIAVRDKCRFTANDAGRFGGGMCVAHRSYADIEDATLVGNQAPSGGGLAVPQAITAYGGATLSNVATLRAGGRVVSVKRCSFTSNRAVNNGAGAYVTTEAYVLLDRSTFEKNVAGFDGGGVSISYDSQVDLVGGNAFRENKATSGNGGAIRARNANLVMTAANQFADNTALAGHGGAVYFSAEHETAPPYLADWDQMLYHAGFRQADLYILDRNVFTGNQARRGGAVEVVWHYWPRGRPPTVKLTVVHENVFERNVATAADGGAIFASDLHRPSVADSNRFASNQASAGGAIQFHECEKIKVVSNTFSSNQATVEGGAIACEHCEKINVSANSFTGDTAPVGADLRFHACSMGGQSAASISAANGGNVTVSISP